MSARSWVVAILATVAVLANGAPAQTPPATNQPAAAVVNGEVIPLADVETIVKERGPTATPSTEVQRRQMQFSALEMLIEDVLMRQFLRKHGPKVEPAEVSIRFRELEDGLKKQGKTLQEFYRETRQNEFQVRGDIYHMLQWAEYVKGRFTETDIKRYYNDNRAFFDQATVHCSHILLRLPANASPQERQAARVKLQALRQEIGTGKLDFAEAAKRVSQCPSAPNGGDLGFIHRKFEVDENFARVAFALKIGDLSDVVETDFGLHLLKVSERTPGTPSDYARIKDDVREIYAEEMRQALLANERRAAQIQVYLK